MTTPWKRIKDQDYRVWLAERQINEDEFNKVSVLDRSELRSKFDEQKKANGEKRFRLVIFATCMIFYCC